MSKIQIIVFSFNRALQLDTLLCTMLEHWKSPAFNLDVVYNTTTPDYQRGYDILINKLSSYENIKFHKESRPADQVLASDLLHPHNLKRWLQHEYLRHPRTNFRSLVINLMEHSSSDLVMFMTDDAMYVNDVEIHEEMLKWISDNPLHNQYTLRVGIGMDDKNATYQDNGEYLTWNFDKEDIRTNWGYHFSVDAHIYSKEVVLKLFKRNLFVNPNSLEGTIQSDAQRHGWLENGRGPRQAAILSFPINMVQTIADNETLGVSTEKLNDYYLRGYTMRYPVPESPNHFQHYPRSLFFYKGDECETIKMA